MADLQCKTDPWMGYRPYRAGSTICANGVPGRAVAAAPCRRLSPRRTDKVSALGSTKLHCVIQPARSAHDDCRLAAMRRKLRVAGARAVNSMAFAANGTIAPRAPLRSFVD